MAGVAETARLMIEAAWPQGRVYAAGAVPKLPLPPYVVVYADAGRDDTAMLDGSAGTDGNRLMPMALGKTEGELDRAVSAIKRGLRGKWIDADDITPGLVGLESSGGTVRDPDGGSLLSKTLFLTFHASEEIA